MTQIIVAALVAFFVSIFLTPVLIKRFSEGGIGQEIREEGLKSHLRKRGTPTMGGIAILAGITVGYVVSVLVGLIFNGTGPGASGWLVLGLTLALGLLGFADDFIKVFKGRNLGLNAKAKLAGQLVTALVFGILILQFPNEDGLTPASTNLSFTRDINTIDLAVGGTVIGTIIFLVFIYLVISAWSNAVNLTDGLDGLASGVTAMVLTAYVAITFWQFRNSCGVGAEPGCYAVRDPLDLAMLAAAGLGACVGFLWWNAAPAKIFMGDTGSLALGGLVAGLSIASRTELLMIIVGLLFVMEAASVVIQVVSFKTTGRRVFRMAPFHHHFEAGGWAETTVTIRFWLLSALFAVVGMAIFYSEWLSGASL
ncbi:MAG: phospho-N-acetylmuramoyl-pentapeptide-transferase [Corynebacterium sp.]|uniref:phospho-N-acetylmuramoyl-pentapeptide- transferase n=1 Tax=Corynebacterium TaxID=1716 RepID=UPI0026492778|nr:phospho-N-acetylmuramoyl-pentapeptide-transferase [Corynebacterium sp.]MDN5721712.1 phospho-N-acetylmuramoyl-pentapeptide-transferase [Corynebacterium sp.]MDN6283147.1 phospho-N-acetylmuramoyl-pentapeptide-transferase [Corynebacterium sp.]MDN6304586.1 phospho-N-acetylmuramoyl-pentapeptide-transferase [Corynebacterium sp.]MDN6367674.1 phospho-N-acetylmuramoyl-pentapeptide-transferase [Corynebacterium sp.]MDN6375591.1 phospho-N-acetylmuramoyl-pentapeptide-transferase [Corynebacterium sp.]